MLEFVTDPAVRILGDESYQLVEDYVIKYYDWTFIIPAGFKTDLASVPRIPLAYMIFGGKAKKAAIFHDYLYTTQELSRLESDTAFLDAMEAQGVPLLERLAMYRGVRIGGGSYWSKGPRPVD